jgi:hypothetical protein
MAGITGDRVSSSKRQCGGSQIDAVYAVAGKEGSDPYYSMVSMATGNRENMYEAAASTTINAGTKTCEIKDVPVNPEDKKLVVALVLSVSVVTLLAIFSCLVALFLETSAQLQLFNSDRRAHHGSSVELKLEENMNFYNESISSIKERLESILNSQNDLHGEMSVN